MTRNGVTPPARQQFGGLQLARTSRTESRVSRGKTHLHDSPVISIALQKKRYMQSNKKGRKNINKTIDLVQSAYYKGYGEAQGQL